MARGKILKIERQITTWPQDRKCNYFNFSCLHSCFYNYCHPCSRLSNISTSFWENSRLWRFRDGYWCREVIEISSKILLLIYQKITLTGAFVASNAMASSDAKSTEMKLNRLILTKSLPLLVVGIIRWASTAAIGYHVDATEYGVHWNFFFSLFVVKVAGPILIRCFRRVPPLVLGIMLITAYEFILRYTGLDETILDRIHPRTSFFLQNKDRVLIKNNRK